MPNVAGRRAHGGSRASHHPCAHPAGEQQQPGGDGGGSLLGSVGLWALWIGLGAYTFLVAPNQTPLRDSYFIEKLIGFDSGDGVKVRMGSWKGVCLWARGCLGVG